MIVWYNIKETNYDRSGKQEENYREVAVYKEM